ncbi:MAG: transposase family protein [Planctomycetes bacterium]|nr:transposase family protein [Planctomycetota bacterium]MBL7037084.1 transposase family protein [Pirellulaceae bacterium]
MAGATVSLDSVVKYFESLPDPRHTRNRRHLLVDVIVIAVCGVIVGCEGLTAIERWAKAKKDWDNCLSCPMAFHLGAVCVAFSRR